MIRFVRSEEARRKTLCTQERASLLSASGTPCLTGIFRLNRNTWLSSSGRPEPKSCRVLLSGLIPRNGTSDN